MDKEHVIILHGIFRTPRSMEPLAQFLKAKGYDVHNIGYASTDDSPETLTQAIYSQVKSWTDNPQTKVNIVCYSMGCLLTRVLIHQHRPTNLGRVVMLAPPNQGSEVADFLKKYMNWWYKPLYGPAGQQLGTNQEGIRAILGNGPVDYDVGVIAGNASIDPFSSAIIPGDNDGKVAVSRTHLLGEKDHIIMDATHTFIMKNKKVMSQVEYFLGHGVFQR